METASVVKLGIVQTGLELYLVVDATGRSASLVAVTPTNITVRDVQDLTKKGT